MHTSAQCERVYTLTHSQSGAPPLSEELSSVSKYPAEEFKKLVDEGHCIVLDTRDVCSYYYAMIVTLFDCSICYGANTKAGFKMIMKV